MRDLRPYDADRINDLLTLSDFNAIKAAGFNHVRFPIDPACVGADPITGEINPNMLTSLNIIAATGRQSSADQNIQAIKNTIDEALTAGLAIIIDFHPNYLNDGHRRDPRWAPTTGYLPYISIFKEKLVTSTGPVTVNHPLARFWDTFLDQIAPPGSTADANPGKVYFEIMNEPLIDFAQSRIGPAGSWELIWKPWFDQSIANWKTIQLNALQVCLAKKPNHKFIVSTAMADTADFGEPYPTGNGNWANSHSNDPTINRVPSFGSRYSVAQMGGSQNLSRVIYTAHLYSPFAFTHFQTGSNLEGEQYDLHPDRSGQQRVGGPITPDFWDAMYPRLEKVNGWIANQTLLIQEGNAFSVNPPPIMLTEMGVHKRGSCSVSEPTLCIIPPPTADWKPKNIQNDAFVWHHDAREKLDSMGVGWSVYEWIGEMGVSKMTRAHVSLGGTRTIHGHPLVTGGANGYWEIRPEFAYALFKTPFTDSAGISASYRGGRLD